MKQFKPSVLVKLAEPIAVEELAIWFPIIKPQTW